MSIGVEFLILPMARVSFTKFELCHFDRETVWQEWEVSFRTHVRNL